MATVTDRVRYISLFTAMRHLRQQSRTKEERSAKVTELTRHLEALVAASSVLHHEADGATPGGIVGANAARGLIGSREVNLRLPNAQPAFNIFRGTLGALGLFDVSPRQRSNPLFESAIPLGEAWDVTGAGAIGRQLQKGELPPTLPLRDVKAACGSFCLCRVPNGSAEQRELIRLLLAFDRDLPPPEFREGPTTSSLRSLSWGFALHLVALSPDRALSSETLMNRLLEEDLSGAMSSQALVSCLLLWRWVAARAFFERGWTVAFNGALSRLRGEPEGLQRSEFREACVRRYVDDEADEPVANLLAEARQRMRDSLWLQALHRQPGRRDALLLTISGVECARSDVDTFGDPLLHTLFAGRAIPFASEEERIQRLVAEGKTASQYWAELSEETLVQHVHVALRKMSAGNPDSLHVDFDGDRWFIPAKALSWAPQLAGGRSRLDIAIGWAVQLGLIDERDNRSYVLTRLGEQTRDKWRGQRAHWP